ncbi:hypothetical protein BD289DRAFT_20068 [Coniella lustricola]|uniref:CCCH zinc finger and RRM domain-containing protein n=1 Tax=Coniella lustricola TaxID=2025994 RepID=A0A2T3AJG4_9PEZI|nr:hypothetical protein BD289DRAFT_20068 [Coniella lustricola]
MLFPEEDSPVLKDWIVKRLENTSDADADVLADYVLALLHNANDDVDIQKVFEDEITPFLKEDTNLFANDLTQAIKYKSYTPGAPPPPPPSQPGIPASRPPFGADTLLQPSFPIVPPAVGARKRGFHDRGDFDAPNGRDQFQGGNNGRPFKQARRAGRKGYIDPDRPRPVQQPQYGYPHAIGQGSPPSFASAGSMLPLDASNPLEALRQLQQLQQQLQMQMAPFAEFNQQQQPPSYGPQRGGPQKKRGRCRDYDTKGYCARGPNCHFEHGNSTEAMLNLPMPQSSGQIRLAPEEYDPTNAVMPQLSQAQQSNGFPSHRRDKRQGSRPLRNSDPRASFSLSGPVLDRTKTKVVVESIPEENFDEGQVRDFFSQFGTIEEVTMMPYKRLAIIKFDNWGSANAAYKSPKVIFDNRFVKVFWYREGDHADIGKPGSTEGKNGFKTSRGPYTGSTEGQDPDFDMSEFTRKQEEAQKLHEEKQRHKQELDKQRAELEKRQKELKAKHEAEKQRLLAKLSGSHKSVAQDSSGVKAENGEDAKNSSASQTEALRATLARLQEEAKQFGLNPDAHMEEDATISTTFSPSYHPRGGRGGYSRGRASYVPRGSYRGAAHGGGGRGHIHAAYAAFSLDNRPRKVALEGVDFSAPEKDEALRQHLFSLGEFTAEIQVTPTVAHISFNDRKAAEKFYQSVDKTPLPGLAAAGEELQVSWVSNTAGPLPGSSTVKVGPSAVTAAVTSDSITNIHNGDAGGAMAEEGVDATGIADSVVAQNGVGGAGSGAGAGTGGGGSQQGAEMDYDVAGENEWDIA